jgi:signal transduction histidine kinase
MEEIFEEFTRLEPGAERGSGLGLTISRGIARALGGDITVRSGDGVGSVFTLWIPLRPPAEPAGMDVASEGRRRFFSL